MILTYVGLLLLTVNKALEINIAYETTFTAAIYVVPAVKLRATLTFCAFGF